MSEIDHLANLNKPKLSKPLADDFALNQLALNKTLLIICFITFVAVFDFSIYMFLSDVVTQTFFIEMIPSSNYSSIWQLTGLFLTGFIARPIGAYFIGRYGDTKGRKPALLISMFIFCITTIMMACLPSYAQIGIMAPILLIIILLLQGAAFGSQLILGWVYVAESMPRKNLAIYISIVCASIMLGYASCTTVASLLNHTFNDSQFVSYGWRIVFIISALLSFIAVFLAQQLEETPLFLDYKAKALPIKQQPVFNPVRHGFKPLILAIVLSLIISNLMIIISIVMPELIALKYSIEASMLCFANIVGILFIAVGMVFYGWLGVKLGVGRTLVWGSGLLAISAFIFFYYLSNSGGHYIVLMYAFLGFCSGIVSLCALIIFQLFPIHMRLTATAVVLNCVAVLSGAILPRSLLHISDTISSSPALYIFFISICAFLVGLHSMHSKDTNLGEVIDIRFH